MILSVKAQTYTNWELILIDDGSKDGSGNICDKYADKRINVYHNENQGQMIARISGIEKATGDYTVVVDADDYMENDYLKVVDDVLNNHEYDMVITPYASCDEKLNEVGLSSELGETGEKNVLDVIRWVIQTYNHGLYNKVFRTECIKQGAKEATRKRLLVNGDYALIIPVLCHVKTAYYVSKAFYKYRVYSTSICHNYKPQHLADTCFVTEKVLEELELYGYADEKNKKYVFEAFLHMISWMVEALIVEKKLKPSDINTIHMNDIYNISREYESRGQFSKKEHVELFIVRNKAYWLASVLRMILTTKRKLIG